MSVSSFITPNAASSHQLNKLYKTLELSPFSIQTHFFKSIPIPKLTLNFKSNFPFSRLISANSATFDGAELNQEAQIPESGDGVEKEGADNDVSEEKDESESGGADAIEARRLYVGNLPFAMTSSQLADIFGEAGNVASVEVVYDRVTGRSRGFAFVTMGSAEEAKEAIRMFEGSQVGGRDMKVNFPEVPKGGEKDVLRAKIRSGYRRFVDTPHKLYVGNLSWSITSEKLTEVFSDQPGFISAKVIFEKNTGRSRGFGFVTFESAEASASALGAKNEVEVEGRLLRLYAAENETPPLPLLTQRDSFLNPE